MSVLDERDRDERNWRDSLSDFKDGFITGYKLPADVLFDRDEAVSEVSDEMIEREGPSYNKGVGVGASAYFASIPIAGMAGGRVVTEVAQYLPV